MEAENLKGVTNNIRVESVKFDIAEKEFTIKTNLNDEGVRVEVIVINVFDDDPIYNKIEDEIKNTFNDYDKAFNSFSKLGLRYDMLTDFECVAVIGAVGNAFSFRFNKSRRSVQVEAELSDRAQYKRHLNNFELNKLFESVCKIITNDSNKAPIG